MIEVEFSGEVSAGQGLIALQTPGFPSFGPVIPARESHPRPRVLRLTPITPLPPGSYLIVVSPKVGGGYFSLSVTAAVTAEIQLTPEHVTAEPIVVIDGVEARTGRRIGVARIAVGR